MHHTFFVLAKENTDIPHKKMKKMSEFCRLDPQENPQENCNAFATAKSVQIRKNKNKNSAQSTKHAQKVKCTQIARPLLAGPVPFVSMQIGE